MHDSLLEPKKCCLAPRTQVDGSNLKDAYGTDSEEDCSGYSHSRGKRCEIKSLLETRLSNNDRGAFKGTENTAITTKCQATDAAGCSSAGTQLEPGLVPSVR